MFIKDILQWAVLNYTHLMLTENYNSTAFDSTLQSMVAVAYKSLNRLNQGTTSHFISYVASHFNLCLSQEEVYCHLNDFLVSLFYTHNHLHDYRRVNKITNRHFNDQKVALFTYTVTLTATKYNFWVHTTTLLVTMSQLKMFDSSFRLLPAFHRVSKVTIANTLIDDQCRATGDYTPMNLTV